MLVIEFGTKLYFHQNVLFNKPLHLNTLGHYETILVEL